MDEMALASMSMASAVMQVNYSAAMQKTIMNAQKQEMDQMLEAMPDVSQLSQIPQIPQIPKGQYLDVYA